MADSTVAALTKAGWTQSRAADSTDAVTALRRAGYEPWASLIAFLQEFGGLVVRFMRNGREDSLWFDPERAMALTFESWIEEYSRRAGTQLAPVGFANHDHLLLLKGADGRWFGGYDEVFGEMGADDWDMLEVVLQNKTALLDG